MVRKVDLESAKHTEVFANPAPLGLIGLAIACAALTPLAFGYGLEPTLIKATFKTAGMYALLFGAGCQFLCGMMEYANKNTYGGTIFTTFAFNWFFNYWAFNSTVDGVVPDHYTVLAVEATMLVIFSALTYGFGFFSSLLFYFLLDIDILYVFKIIKALFGISTLLNIPIAICTVIMGLLALWIALAALINPVAGRQIFKMTGPVFFAPKKSLFDFSVRYNIFEILYNHWKENAYQEMKFADLQLKVKDKAGTDNIVPELFYLQEFGYVALNFDVFEKEKVMSLRLNAHGIDLYEQLILKKYEWK